MFCKSAADGQGSQLGMRLGNITKHTVIGMGNPGDGFLMFLIDPGSQQTITTPITGKFMDGSNTPGNRDLLPSCYIPCLLVLGSNPVRGQITVAVDSEYGSQSVQMRIPRSRIPDLLLEYLGNLAPNQIIRSTRTKRDGI